jgi:hypothetical protein
MIDHTQFYAAKKEAGLKIDPRTAETWWGWGQELDPYNLGDLPEEYECINRIFFARAPGTDEWVEFRADRDPRSLMASWGLRRGGLLRGRGAILSDEFTAEELSVSAFSPERKAPRSRPRCGRTRPRRQSGWPR